MHELYELKMKLLKELVSYNQNSKFSKEDAEIMKYLASAIDHMCNIAKDMEEEGESDRGSYYEEGSYERRGRGSNARRGSYREGSYREGSYRDGGSMRRGSYYREGAKEELIEKIEELVEQTPDENKKQMLHRMIKQIENS